ncbi:E3 SUMO-protein ligase ZBED1 [Bombyx mori]|uniref:BED-type domain-containing protein n=1 Tax=Bombyx mori TaxID=7091 RepID=A0A8R2M710_BOMMO|nr:E3 SUMO-protein ligase ZBED1-like [Bombyx mori]
MASKRKYSPLWTHFEETAPKKAKCVYCSRILTLSSSLIGSLSRHMKSVHPTVNIKVERQGTLSVEDISATSGKPAVQEVTCGETCSRPTFATNAMTVTTTTGTASTSRENMPSIKDYVVIKKPLPQHKLQQLDDQLVRMIAKGYHALRMLDEKEFRKFVEMLNPGYTLPTRKTLSESLLPKVYNKVLESAKFHITKATAVCITTDGWPSIVNDGYIAITAHFIDHEIDQICSVMIGCINLEERHTSINLKDFLQEKFIEWGIDRRIGAVVSDNAANIVGAVQLGGWRTIRCFAHSLNLVMQASIIKIEETIIKVKHVVEYFHRSSPGAKKLKEIQQQMELEPLKLKQDVITRWNSTYDMLHRIVKIKNAVIATLALMRNDLSLSQDDWTIIEKSIPLLNIFYEVTKEISGEEYVTASKVIVYCKLINKQIEKCTEETLAPIQELIKSLALQMTQRFHDIESNVLLSEATILDPRFKKNGFSSVRNYERAAAQLKLKIGAIDNSSVVVPVEERQMTTRSSIVKSIWEDFDTEVSKLVPENPVAAGIVEFDKYMLEPLIKRHENPLKWWKDRKAVYPRLYSFMLKRLNIVATSVPCERVFSKAGLTLNERRTRLKTKKLSQLMFISCNC